MDVHVHVHVVWMYTYMYMYMYNKYSTCNVVYRDSCYIQLRRGSVLGPPFMEGMEKSVVGLCNYMYMYIAHVTLSPPDHL